MAARLKEWVVRFALITGSLLFALVCTEILTRLVSPISDDRGWVTLDGQQVTRARVFEPGIVYYQTMSEYRALTTITDKGHRVPGVDGNPDVIFVGDSFTFGWGLSDDESFASIYCKQTQRTCANIAKPGSGTDSQVDRLEEFLDRWNWHPKEVKLFFFGMSDSFSAGNDFVDNYHEGRNKHARSSGGLSIAAPATAISDRQPSPGLAERIINSQSWLLAHSNLLRVVKYRWGPLMKSMMVAEPGAERMSESLLYTERSLKRLHALAERRGFAYNIYLLVPVQDLIRGSYGKTLRTLNSVAPKPAISTAPLFLDSPQDFYFAYDGHINAKASRRIGEYLASLDTQLTSSR